MKLWVRFATVFVLGLLLVACGGGGGGGKSSKAAPANPPIPPDPVGEEKTYQVGLTISGLAENTLISLSDQTDRLNVTVDGFYAFAKQYRSGEPYRIQIATQPAGQPCDIELGQGVVGQADVASVRVLCPHLTYSVGGLVSGLQVGQSLELGLRNQGFLRISGNGTFRFDQRQPAGAVYDVFIAEQPSRQSCTLNQGVGVVISEIRNIEIICTAPDYRLGGIVSGLRDRASVELSLNGEQTQVIHHNGAFQFDTQYPAGTSYFLDVRSGDTDQDCSANAPVGMIGSEQSPALEVVCRTKGQWGDPVLLSTGRSTVVLFPEAAISANGNQLLTWIESSAPYGNWAVWLNQYSEANGWGTTEVIEPDQHSVLDSTVAINNTMAAILWSKDVGLTGQLIARTRQGTGAWSSSVIIDEYQPQNYNYPEKQPKLMIDANNTLHAVWLDEVQKELRYSNKKMSSGWSEPAVLMVDDRIINFAFTTDSSGKTALLVEKGVDSTTGERGPEVWERTFTAATGWQAFRLAPVAATVKTFNNGRALAVWEDKVSHALKLRRYSISAGWGPEEVVAAVAGEIVSVDFTLGDSGKVAVIWLASHYNVLPMDSYRLWVAQTDETGNWLSPELMSSYLNILANIKVLVSSINHTFVTWHFSSSYVGEQMTKHYIPGLGWGPRLYHERPLEVDSVTLDRQGNVHWYGLHAFRDLWYRKLDVTQWPEEN